MICTIVDLPKEKPTLTYVAMGLVTEKGDWLSSSMVHQWMWAFVHLLLRVKFFVRVPELLWCFDGITHHCIVVKKVISHIFYPAGNLYKKIQHTRTNYRMINKSTTFSAGLLSLPDASKNHFQLCVFGQLHVLCLAIIWFFHESWQNSTIEPLTCTSGPNWLKVK